MRAFICLCLAIPLIACRPPADTSKQATSSPSAKSDANNGEIDEGKLYGAWKIVSLGGSAIQLASADRVPRLNFWAGGYGGNTGCNDFGGQGLVRDARYFTNSGPMTAVACPTIDAQENAILALMRDGPRIAYIANGKITLTSKDTRLVLKKDEAATRKMRAQALPAPDLILAGTFWQITSVDGAWLKPRNQRESRPLAFEADYWSGKPACGNLSGAWQQRGRAILATSPKTDDGKGCSPEEAATDARVMDVMAVNPSFATGNLLGVGSELLIVGGGHWLTASRNPTIDDETALVAGKWRLAAIDGVTPKGVRPPTLSFAAGRYDGDTGCNTIGGNFLAQRRRLFTLPTPQTEMGCGDLADQEVRITGLLASSPRVAHLQAGGMALIDARGRLDLQRYASATHSPQSTPAMSLEGITRRVEVMQIDGESIRQPFRLSFNKLRWATTLGCGMAGGDWRKIDSVYWLYADPGTYPPPTCDPALQALKDKLSTVINGPARVLFGPNGEFLLATHDHWIIGQAERP